MILSTFLQVTLTQPQMAAANMPATTDSLNALQLAVKGGWVMIPIAILLIIAVYIFFERFITLRNASKIDVNFMNRIKDYIHDGKFESATALCQSTDNPVARMIEKGISRLGRPLNDINTAIENIGNLEIAKLEKGLPTLATIAGGAPMLGFFGTVIGMVEAFYNMAQAGNNINIGLLSSGIYVAMITTVGGLIVGILAFFAYNYLVSSVSHIVYKLEASTTEFMDLLNEPVS